MKQCVFKSLTIGTIMLISINQLMAISIPNRVLGRPEKFEQSNPRSYDWEEDAKQRNFGNLTENAWIVYAISKGITVYEEPSFSSQKINTTDIQFMEDFYVADIRGDFMLLIYTGDDLNNRDLVIPDKIRNNRSVIKHSSRSDGYIGWVNIDDLLLWDICPRTKDGIFKKVAIAKDVDLMSASTAQSMPQLYNNSECKKDEENIRYLNAFEFYFLLKKNQDGNALVYSSYILSDNMKDEAYVGWIRYGEFIDWNTRVCWEPAFEGSLNDYAYTFQSEDDAYDYNMHNLRSSSKLDGKRKSAQFEPRSPVINFKTPVALLSVLANKTEGSLIDYVEMQKQLKQMENSLNKINLVFVMDATNSMKSCFTAMSNAVAEIANYRYGEGSNVRFGAVIFRNYKDKASGGLIESYPLTSDPQNMVDYLKNVKCYSVSKDPQEAMFKGLTYAADNMGLNSDESNYIILISDVSSKSPDAEGWDVRKVADKLAKKKINLVAFQARSQEDAVYQDFGSQMEDVITNTLRQLGYPYNHITYNGQSQISIYSQKNPPTKWPLRPMGYKIKNSNDKVVRESELQNMATDIIKTFIQTTQKNIGDLKGKVSSGEITTLFDQSICDELIRKQIIQKCEDLRGAIKVAGYAKRENNGRAMFTPCVYMADKELENFIRDLSTATTGSSSNRRGKLQQVIKKMVLSYTGQKFTADAIDLDFGKIMKEVEKECGYHFYQDVKTHVENPDALDDSQVEVIVRRLKNNITTLQNLQNDKSTYKEESKGRHYTRYYYILLRDMPLVEKN